MSQGAVRPGGYVDGFSARVLLDSVSPAGVRVTTMEWTYPRFIHAEVMTYRMFSRNAASSRAIPVIKTIRQVQEHPARPVFWGRNQKGMQAREELTGWRLWLAKFGWEFGRQAALISARIMRAADAHKQLTNRRLETDSWITVIITANQPAYYHCFHQRVHPDAQPEFQHIAMLAQQAFQASKPVERILHAPLMTEADYDDLAVSNMTAPEQYPTILHISTARCARVSYLTHEGKRDMLEDLRLYRDLKRSDPPHTSPFEHVLTASEDPTRRSGNIVGWIQHRETVEAA